MTSGTGRWWQPTPARDHGSAARWRWSWAVAGLTALVVLGPGLAPGHLLVRDMVFVPHPAITGRLLGLGHEAPRVVPSDLVVALAGQVVPGALVQKAVLLAVLVVAGVGGARLAPGGAIPASAAAVAVIWNPFVAERLALGQWALLVGYAALPFVVGGVGRVVSGQGGRVALLVAIVLGSLGGAAAWLLLVVGLVGAVAGSAVASRDLRHVARATAAAWVLVALVAVPWAVPGLLRPSATASDSLGFSVFAPRADTPAGVLVSLLTGGGVWNSDVVPAGRNSTVGLVGALAVLAWCLAGWVLTRGHRASQLDRGAAALRPAVVGAGVTGLLVAVLGALPEVLTPLAHLPGGGLLRDGSRELGPWLVLLAVGAGWGVAWLLRIGATRLLAALAVLLPVAALPALGWGLAGSLSPIRYPDGVLAAVDAVESRPARGAVVVLPFEAYRTYPWNGGRSSLTPWSRLMDERVVVSSDLVVQQRAGEVRVAGEDAYASAVRRALGSPDPARALRELGVGWLVIDAPGVTPPPGTTEVLRSGDAVVLRLDGIPDVEAAAVFDPPTLPVVAGDVLALIGVGVVLVAAVRRGTHPDLPR